MRKQLLGGLLIVAVVVGTFYGYQYVMLELRWNSPDLVLYGNVDIRQAVLGFRVPGRLTALHVEEGDTVQSGKLLAELDPDIYATQLVQAEQRVASVQARAAGVASQQARREALAATKSVSIEDVQNLTFSKQQADADIKEAQGALAEAQLRVSDTRLVAQDEGIVLTRVQEPGAVLSAGQTVLTLSLPKPLWIRTFVSEPELGYLKPGAEALVYTDTSGMAPYKGQVGFISPVAEFTPKSVETTTLRTDLVYQVRIVVSEPDHHLRQGMPVTVKIRK